MIRAGRVATDISQDPFELTNDRATNVVRSPSPCGEGLGVGPFFAVKRSKDPIPPATLRVRRPPHKAEGNGGEGGAHIARE